MCSQLWAPIVSCGHWHRLRLKPTCRTWRVDWATAWARTPSAEWHSWACPRRPGPGAGAWSGIQPPAKGSSHAGIEEFTSLKEDAAYFKYSCALHTNFITFRKLNNSPPSGKAVLSGRAFWWGARRYCESVTAFRMQLPAPGCQMKFPLYSQHSFSW